MIHCRSLLSSWLVFGLISVMVLLLGVVDFINGDYGMVIADILLYICYLILVFLAWLLYPDYDSFPPPTIAPQAEQVDKQDKAA